MLCHLFFPSPQRRALPEDHLFELDVMNPVWQLVLVTIRVITQKHLMKMSVRSSHNVEESVEAQDEVNVQLQIATDEIAKLKQMLDEARLEIFELRKNVARKRFGIELVRESDKDVHFYTGLPSAAVFDRLLEYLNPDGRRSNVVY